MKVKDIVIGILVLAVIGLGWWSFARKDIPEPSEQTPTETPTTSNAPRELKKEKISEEEAYYRIEAYYPLTQNKNANDAFTAFIAEQVLQFKQDTGVENLDPQMALDLGLNADRKYSLTIDYEPVVSDTIYSYEFTTSFDTGGAHPNQFAKTFSFRNDGAVVELADLFQSGKNYLDPISKYVQAELKKREFADADWIAEGAAPKLDNYQNFVIEDTGIEFIFDPYQVAAYAAGTQRVLVPYSVLNPLLRTEYVR